MSDFRELCFINTMRNVIYCLKVRVQTDIETDGSSEIYVSSHQTQRADNIDRVNKFAQN